MIDSLCLLFDPTSAACAHELGFFSFSSFDRDEYTYAYYNRLGLAPFGKLNGPSFVQNLDKNGQILKPIVSFELGEWGKKADIYGNNNVTFGDYIEGSFSGFQVKNKILTSSEWLFNLNY